MTPEKLYERKPEDIDHCIYVLNSGWYNHVPELEFNVLPTEDPGKRISIHTYKYFNFDGRRYWALRSVWLDEKPFMIIQNAGREGDDHAHRFITDVAMYTEAVAYLRTVVNTPDEEIPDVVNVTDEIVSLTEFYGNSLDGFFERYHY